MAAAERDDPTLVERMDVDQGSRVFERVSICELVFKNAPQLFSCGVAGIQDVRY